MRIKSLTNLCFLGLISCSFFNSYAQTEMPEWPTQLEVRGQNVTIYQPQIESYKGERMEARAAFSVEVSTKPIFGALWFSCRVVTDKEQRMVEFDKIQVEEVKFPEDDQQKLDTFKEDINLIFNEVNLAMSLDRFLTDLEGFNDRKGVDLEFNNTPPQIFFETSPTVLVLIDGDPILKDLENSTYKYIVNTPYFMVSDTKTGTNYLKGGKWWFRSYSLTEGWVVAESVPDAISQIANKAFTTVESETDSLVSQFDQPPKVIISTKPAELIQTNGNPEFNPVEGTNLLFVDNSESDIIMNIQTQEYFVLVSGRWYKSTSMESGSWTFVRSDQLPEDFKSIPEDSDISNVRSNVAGTTEAREAILESSIPQTAEVDRKTASVEISFDGDPKFERIEGTNFSYAVNADKTVLKSNNRFYCVDNAIWFESAKATGPWAVSTSVPEGVEDLPPSSPVYNVKYVYIYDHTPEVVYVGYTPGYYWSFPYYGSVIYGTGYYYRPWYYSYYYPRPVTYGFGVHYNPWTGWGFSYGVSYGWLSFSFHSGGYYGWWGPGGYRYGYRHGYYHGYHQGYWAGRRDAVRDNRPTTLPARTPGRVASNDRQRPQSRPSNSYRGRLNGIKSTGVRPSTRPSVPPQRPVNARPAQQPVTATRPGRNLNTSNARPVSTDAARSRANNVYADRNGNIYRQNNSGSWQQRNNGTWQNSGNRSVPTSVNKSYQNRSRGQQRVQSYQSSPARGSFRGAGMRRGR